MIITEDRIRVAAITYNKLHNGQSFTDDELRQTIPIFKAMIDLLNRIDARKLDLFEDHFRADLRSLEDFRLARKEHRRMGII